MKPISPTPSNDNNNWKPVNPVAQIDPVNREEELKREEALLEDEMKEEDEDEDEELDLEDERSSTPVQSSIAPPPLNFGIAESLKRHFESNDKFALLKHMMEKQQVKQFQMSNINFI